MPVLPQKTTERPNYTVPIAIVAIIVLIVFLVILGHNTIGSSFKDQPPLPPQAMADGQWIREKAKESHGDMTKLSPADQQKLQQIAHGYGAMALGSAWSNENPSAGHVKIAE